MDNKLYLTCLWPGLPQLWWRGRLSALPTALAFAFALNVLLVARFIYPEWLAFSLVRMAGWAGVLAWFYCTVKNVRELPGLIQPRKVSDKPDRFVDAQIAFLRSDWARAEVWLKDCLEVEERDPPALLLLAGVYRHTGRLELARACIDTLRMTEAADRWWLEVDAEEKRLLRDNAYQVEAHKVSELPNVLDSTNSGVDRSAIAA
ncbi:MAG: tetratricopeptide repeat protein [Planctomycetaceae bacterium]